MFLLRPNIVNVVDKEATKNCSSSVVTVNAPLFGWSAESNEVLAISQTQMRLQLVEQMICDEEMCRQHGNCRQVNMTTSSCTLTLFKKVS